MREAGTGFGKPDEFGQLREAHIAADLAVGVEQRFGKQAAELETAAEAFDGGAFRVGIAFRHPLDALARHVLGDVFIHFDEDETAAAAILSVLFEHGVSRGAGTCKAVKDQGILVGGDLQDALDQTGGFWRVK
ncbi:MAG: hypothetical protein PHZ14_07765 [Sulfuricella sp.]|nr:hypothetical protein [Sulfuricella sp.]